MGRIGESRYILLTTLYLATTATAYSPRDLFQRASSCPDPSYNQCTQAGVPSTFCCPPGDACIPLAANTTLLCCPPGANCNSVQPITCDISIQNIAIYPNNTLKTTALTGVLPACAGKCCPFGYSCDGTNCIMLADQQTVVPITTSVSSSTPTSSPTSSTTSTSSSNPARNSTSSPILTSSCAHFPTSALLAGFFPGLFLGIFFTLSTICILGHHRQRTHQNQRRRSLASFGFTNISDPQPHPGDMRTDFLRKQVNTPESAEGVPSPERKGTVKRVRSLFQRSQNVNGLGGTMSSNGNGKGNASGNLAPPIPLIPRGGGGDERPVTPAAQREPSFAEIDIFTDDATASALRERARRDTELEHELEHGLRPEGLNVGGGKGRGLRESHQTTFTDMMERSGLAGLKKGEAYVYKGSSLSLGRS